MIVDRPWMALVLVLALTACAETADQTETPTPVEEAGSDAQPYVPPLATSADTPIIIVSDGGHGKVSFLRTDARVVFYELELGKTFDECRLVKGGCVLTEVEHQVHGGMDYLDMNLALSDSSGGLIHPASIKRIRLSDPPEPVFSLERFDFSEVPYGPEICNFDLSDPCESGDAPTCFIWFPHDVEIVYDDPDNQYIEYLITDLMTFRILKVNFDYSNGNTCGKVEWVLDSHTEGWSQFYLPNDADLIHQGDTDYLLTSNYSATPILGASVLELWKRPDGASSWSKVWRYPEPGSSEAPYLNSPHAPVLYTDQEDRLILRYGHSRGDSDMWGIGYHGSLGAAVLDDIESQPVYAFDSKFPDGDPLTPLGFVRDIEPTSDGRLLITDSGCVVPAPCPLEGRIFLIEPEVFSSTPGLSGAWSETRAEQNFLDLDTSKVESYICDISTSYEADFTTVTGLGDDLSAHLNDFDRACPVE